MIFSENAKQGRPYKQIKQYCIEDIKADDYSVLYNEGFCEINLASKHKGKKVDAIIYNRISKKIIGLIEWKKDSSKLKFDEAFNQLRNGADVVKSACIFIITDGKTTVCYNKNFIKLENEIDIFDQFLTKHELSNEEEQKIKKLAGFLELVDENINILSSNTPPSKLVPQINEINLFHLNSENMVSRIHQMLWIATGEEPLSCLHTFTELLIYKILSDLKILDEKYTIKSISKQSSASLKDYRELVRTKIKEIFKGNPSIINGFIYNKQDSEFKDVLKLIDSIGDFSTYLIDSDFKRKLMEYFLKQSGVKIRNGQHLTPRNIVNTMWSLADVKNGNVVFDPACGVGGFLLEYYNLTLTAQSNLYNLTDVKLVGYDFSDRMIILSKANFIIHTLEVLRKITVQRNFEGDIVTEEFKKYIGILNNTFFCTNETGLGSLSNIYHKQILGNENIQFDFADVVLTNVPFVSDGSGEKKKNLKGILRTYYNNCGSYTEGMFIRYIRNSLKSGGEAFIIVPHGILTRNCDKSKEDILENFNIKAIISLPKKIFDNTDWKTYILCLQKKAEINSAYRKPILLYNVENVGFSLDANRIDSASDLEDLISKFKCYIRDNADSKEILSNRCNVISQEEFKSLNNWEDAFLWCKIQYKRNDINNSELEKIMNNSKTKLDNIFTTFKMNNKISNQVVECRLGNEYCFEILKDTIGLTQKQYIPLNLGEHTAGTIPIYTAKLEPVAYINELDYKTPYYASNEHLHISIANDGDGTAGKNIVLHNRPYYINTSRVSIIVKCDDILPEYLFYELRDIKKKYGFDFTKKLNPYLPEITIAIPIKLDENGNPIKILRKHDGKEKEDFLYDIDAQKIHIQNMNLISNTKKDISDEMTKIISILEDI